MSDDANKDQLECLNWACDYQNNNECCHKNETCEIRLAPNAKMNREGNK
jgi:hypothetical protein